MARMQKTPTAERCLIDIARYIARDSGSLKIALEFLDRMDEKCRLYAAHPLMGVARPDLGPRVRCFRVDRYVVIYEPLADGITVLLVIHGARDIPRHFRRLMRRPPRRRQ